MATYYEDLFTALADAEVRFVVVGGLAVILHGVPRTTADVDIVLDLEQENVKRFVEVVARLGFRPRIPVPAEQLADPSCRESWIEDQGLRAFSFHRGGRMEELDVLLVTPLDYEELRADARAVAATGVTLHIASIDALITMKEAAGRMQDRSDADALRRLKEALDDG